MNLVRGNGGATGYHMRHDQLALPSRGVRGDLHALLGCARRYRPVLSATSRPPHRPGARRRTHRRPGPTHGRRIVGALQPALRGRESGGRGGPRGGRVRRAFRAQRLYAALREYQRARRQSRSAGNEHALRSRHRVRADRFRLQFAAAARRESEGPLSVRAGTRRLRSEEHTSELQSHLNLVCRLLLEKKKKKIINQISINKKTEKRKKK